MSSKFNPSLEDRRAGAAASRQKALDALRNKPPVDDKIVAARQEAVAKREAAQLEKRNARLATEAAAKEAKVLAAAKPAAPTPPTAAEMKAARDARYAARKTRK